MIHAEPHGPRRKAVVKIEEEGVAEQQGGYVCK